MCGWDLQGMAGGTEATHLLTSGSFLTVTALSFHLGSWDRWTLPKADRHHSVLFSVYYLKANMSVINVFSVLGEVLVPNTKFTPPVLPPLPSGSPSQSHYPQCVLVEEREVHQGIVD